MGPETMATLWKGSEVLKCMCHSSLSPHTFNAWNKTVVERSLDQCLDLEKLFSNAEIPTILFFGSESSDRSLESH